MEFDTTLELSTCSNLNLSAQLITGRQINWSINTITATIAARPQSIARVFPWPAAVCKYDPSPGKRKSLSPSTNISQAIRKNHPPATDIMEFHTSPIVEKGRSSSVNFCHALNR